MIININKSHISREYQCPEISLTNPINEINNFIIIIITLPFFSYNMNVISRECNMNLIAIICHSCILLRYLYYDAFWSIKINKYNNLINE